MVERPAVNGKVASSSLARGGLLPGETSSEARAQVNSRFLGMHYTYILKSPNTDIFHTVSTSDLKRRLQEHNMGISLATKPYVPGKVFFYAAFESEILAKSFEKYLNAADWTPKLQPTSFSGKPSDAVVWPGRGSHITFTSKVMWVAVVRLFSQ